MLCAPLHNSFRSDSPTRADDTINRVSLEQLRAGILERCVPGRLNAPYVALIDFTMYHPFRHCLSRAAHKAYAIFHGSSEENRHRRNASRR